MEVTKTRVKELVAEHLGVQLSEVNDETTYIDLGVDSLDKIEIIMAMEAELFIVIPDGSYENVDSMPTLYQCLESRGITLID